jgi:hypothetical protein
VSETLLDDRPKALSSQHRTMLERGSAIAPEVIAERGYWTAEDWQDLEGLGFRGTQKRPECFPALIVPQYAPDGEYTYSALRYDVPPIDRNGRPMKYLNPKSVGLRLDVPRRCLAVCETFVSRCGGRRARKRLMPLPASGWWP